jgi:hypothetical protein
VIVVEPEPQVARTLRSRCEHREESSGKKQESGHRREEER